MVGLPSLKVTFSHLKIDGWKTRIISFWGPASWQVRSVSFRECNFQGQFWCLNGWTPPPMKPRFWKPWGPPWGSCFAVWHPRCSPCRFHGGGGRINVAAKQYERFEEARFFHPKRSVALFVWPLNHHFNGGLFLWGEFCFQLQKKPKRWKTDDTFLLKC